ncbi:MAG: GNAT family N-acetyltransferase [Nocardioidaceae bacterium]|nr:GNAT family N-acetyltransferase [Nocardioidaceae bacterium]
MTIRPLGDSDFDSVLMLNEQSVHQLSPLSREELAEYLSMAVNAMVCEADGHVAGFALAFEPGTSYDSINYRWHGELFDDFLYLDRIAVSPDFRRRGIATGLYDEMERLAAPHGRMVCEVNSKPANVESLAFHSRRGYRELGHLVQADGHETVMLEKPL